MRKTSWIFLVLFVAGAAEAMAAEGQNPAAAKSPDRPRWDVNLNAGFFGHRPGEGEYPYDDWYSEGRYAAAIGYYWTEHLATEIEFAHSGEGRQYIQERARVPGTGAFYPVPVEAFHRLQQTSLRLVWQFGDNTWVHPYVNAGYVLHADRRRRHSPVTYSYPGDPRVVPPVLVRAATHSGPDIVYRGGASIGGGAKFYVAPAAYLNTGVQWTSATPARTITFLGGFGFEF